MALCHTILPAMFRLAADRNVGEARITFPSEVSMTGSTLNLEAEDFLHPLVVLERSVD